MTEARQTICLCMIVKNELPVIGRCLASVRPLLDSWVIVDTGSTDGTQQRIREELHDLPGELFERPWVHFAHNRTEALHLARGRADFLLIIDADEVLESDPGFRLPHLVADEYQFRLLSGPVSYYKTQLVRDSLDWYFTGVLHEHIFTDRLHTQARLPGVRTLRFPDGARARDPLTYRRDTLVLEEALLREPENARYLFYLAQSYADAGEPAVALDRYTRRVALGGWAEEVWYSLYQIANLKQVLGKPWEEVMAAYLAAFSFRPARAEPLFHIGFHYQGLKEFSVAHLFFARAIELPYPDTEVLFVNQHIYDVLLPLEHSVACFYVGRHREAILTANRLLAGLPLAPDLREQVIRNREFSLEALSPQRAYRMGAPSCIVVAVDAQEPSCDLLRCLGSLLEQQVVYFQAVVVVGPAHQANAEHQAARDSRLRVVLAAGPLDSAACLQHAVERAGPDDVVYGLSACDFLPDASCLKFIADHFASYESDVLLGQYRGPFGEPGDTVPFASQEDFEAALSSAALPSAAAPAPSLALPFRRSLLGDSPVPRDRRDLLRKAGFARVRFRDQPILVHVPESIPVHVPVSIPVPVSAPGASGP